MSHSPYHKSDNPFLTPSLTLSRHDDSSSSSSDRCDDPSIQCDEFQSVDEVQQFFVRIGQALQFSPISQKLQNRQLSDLQLMHLDSIKKRRLCVYQSLNSDIYTCFSKLFYLMSYLYQIVEELHPILNNKSLQQDQMSIYHAYLQINERNLNLQSQISAQQKDI